MMEIDGDMDGLTDRSFNRGDRVQELQHSAKVERKDKKKRHGNRKLQRYRRKLRHQARKFDTVITSTIATDNNGMNTAVDQSSINDLVGKSSSNGKTKQKKPDGQQNPSNNTKEAIDHLLPSKKSKMKTLVEQSSFIDTPDHIFHHMLLTAFQTDENMARILKGKEAIGFARQYADLLDRLSSLKLRQAQWDYYHHIGVTENIWSNRVPKHVAERNSMVHAYGRSKHMIGQRRTLIQQKLEQVKHDLQQFERGVSIESTSNADYSSELTALSSILNTFVHENQQRLREEFVYNRKMLLFDANDHRLVQAFFDLKPKKGQIHSARRIWQATTKQITFEREVTILERRLTAKHLRPLSTIFDLMIDNIDEMLVQPNDVQEQATVDELQRMKQLKDDVIHQSILTGLGMAENFRRTVMTERENYFVKSNVDTSTSEWQLAGINAIEDRRLHMLERADYITQYQLATDFKNK